MTDHGGLPMIALALLVATADLPLSARVVEANGTAYALEDAEFLLPGVIDASWSPDGKQILIHALDPPDDASGRAPSGQKEILLLWNAETRKLDGGSVRFDRGPACTTRWEGPSGSVIYRHGDATWRLTKNGSQKLIISPDARLATSTKIGGILVIDADIRWIPPGGTSGSVVTPVSGPEKRQYADRGDLYGTFFDPAGKSKPLDVLFDEATRGWRRDARPPEPEPPVLSIESGETMVALGAPEKLPATDALWVLGDLKSRYPAALLAARGSFGEVAPKLKDAFYLDGSNLFVRKLSKLTPEQLDLVLEAEERVKLMSDAKQVGTALLIFAADNDDRFPAARGWDDAVEPYIKNRSLTDGFVYSYRGPEDLTKIENPSLEIVGYKEGRFGRAVVFADGSARWEKRKKP